MNQGAEAKTELTSYAGVKAIRKHRLPKKYRVAELDEKVNKQRLLQEARCLFKCRSYGVNAPNLFMVDLKGKILYLEYIKGRTLKQILNDESIVMSFKRSMLAGLAQQIAKMHDAEIVHGDLTTSNVIVRDADDAIFLIDFGLGLLKPTVEDKAIDLYVLERAFSSTHPNTEHLVQEFFHWYIINSVHGVKVQQKYDQVRRRGRKRDMLG